MKKFARHAAKVEKITETLSNLFSSNGFHHHLIMKYLKDQQCKKFSS